MKPYEGVEVYETEVGGQLHAPAALPVACEAGWAPESVLDCMEKNFAPAGNLTPTVQSVACRYTDLAHPAVLN
jgi:hypothetical protein